MSHLASVLKPLTLCVWTPSCSPAEVGKHIDTVIYCDTSSSCHTSTTHRCQIKIYLKSREQIPPPSHIFIVVEFILRVTCTACVKPTTLMGQTNLVKTTPTLYYKVHHRVYVQLYTRPALHETRWTSMICVFSLHSCILNKTHSQYVNKGTTEHVWCAVCFLIHNMELYFPNWKLSTNVSRGFCPLFGLTWFIRLTSGWLSLVAFSMILSKFTSFYMPL